MTMMTPDFKYWPEVTVKHQTHESSEKKNNLSFVIYYNETSDFALVSLTCPSLSSEVSESSEVSDAGTYSRSINTDSTTLLTFVHR